ncbi:MAG: hypothetical protein HY865_18215 [Chloroflexi bacterium]|nr:hypothetical protein [Chloroflexota bacterium]
MAEKINLDTLSTDLRTVIKPDNGHVVSKLTGIWNNANLLRIRSRERVQPSVSDLRMVVRIHRKNKHPHSTKKHK